MSNCVHLLNHNVQLALHTKFWRCAAVHILKTAILSFLRIKCPVLNVLKEITAQSISSRISAVSAARPCTQTLALQNCKYQTACNTETDVMNPMLSFSETHMGQLYCPNDPPPPPRQLQSAMKPAHCGSFWNCGEKTIKSITFWKWRKKGAKYRRSPTPPHH